jgi:hypothetical protein
VIATFLLQFQTFADEKTSEGVRGEGHFE